MLNKVKNLKGWNKVENKIPTKELVEIYKEYLEELENEAEEGGFGIGSSDITYTIKSSIDEMLRRYARNYKTTFNPYLSIVENFNFTFKTTKERYAMEAVEDLFEYECVRVVVENESCFPFSNEIGTVDYPLKDEEEFEEFLKSGKEYTKIYQTTHGYENKIDYEYMDY